MLLLQRGDLLHLDAGPQLDLVAGDGGPAGAAGDGRVDLELVEHLADGVGHLVVGGTALLRRVAGHQQVQRRQRVGTLDDPVQRAGVLFAAARRAARGDGGFRDGGNVVLERAPGQSRPTATPAARRRGRRCVSVVVVTVGKVLACAALRVVGELVAVVAVLVVRNHAAPAGCRTWRAPRRAPRGSWSRSAAAARTARR